MPANKRFLLPAVLAATVTLPVLPVMAFDDAEKAEIGQIVRDYLLENPEIIGEMQQVLEDRERIAQEQQIAETLELASDSLFNDPDDPVVGNPDGDVTIVEFFDYNCGFCRRAHADLVTLLESDAKVRVVMKEFPILGPDSQAAHTVSMAFHSLMPDQYKIFMDRLITAPGRASEASAVALAVELGADEAELRSEMTNPDLMAQVQETYQLASRLGINGTPSYVIGDQVLAGAVGSATLAAHIEKERECAVTSC